MSHSCLLIGPCGLMSQQDEDYVMDLGDGDKGSDLDSDGEFDRREVREPTKKQSKAKTAKVNSLFHLS